MIQEGLLWFDDDPIRAVGDKVARAVQRYQQKYGHNPDVCYVHPAQIKERELNIGPVRVLPTQMVLPNHFWLGVTLEGKKDKRNGQRGQVI
jgi:hypothetical protein